MKDKSENKELIERLNKCVDMKRKYGGESFSINVSSETLTEAARAISSLEFQLEIAIIAGKKLNQQVKKLKKQLEKPE